MGRKTKQNKNRGRRGGHNHHPNDNQHPNDATTASTSSHPSRAKQPSAIPRKSLYGQYKTATSLFRNELISLLKPFQLPLGDHVHSFVEAVDALTVLAADGTRIEIKKGLLRNLRTVIRLRERVGRSYENEANNDPGHAYFIQVLKYSYRRLQTLEIQMQPVEVVSASETGSKSEAITNAFQALSIQGEEENEENLLEDEPVKKDIPDSSTTGLDDEADIERPQEPDTYYLIADDLIEGSEYFKAAMFLQGMDMLVDEVSTAYQKLGAMTSTSADNQELAFQMMKCAILANEAIREMMYMEQVLTAEQDHLNTLPRLVSYVQFADHVSTTQKRAEEKADHGFDEHKFQKAAIRFFGDSMETIMELKVGNSEAAEEHGRWRRNMFDFVQDWNLGTQEGGMFPFLQRILLMRELGLWRQDVKPSECLEEQGIIFEGDIDAGEPRSWLKPFPHLSGASSIVETVYFLLQFRSNVNFRDAIYQLDTDKLPGCFKDLKVPDKRGVFGFRFLTHCMLQLCERSTRQGWVHQHTMALFPLLQLIRDYVFKRQEHISISLVFAVHLIRICVLELDIKVLCRLGLVAKLSVSRFYNGVVSECGGAEGPSFDIFSSFSSETVWNPVAGGMLLLQMAMMNLVLGCTNINYHSQIRDVLHLYNALRKQRLLEDIAFVSELDLIFGKSNSVWSLHAKPEVNNFAIHYWLSHGLRLDYARKVRDKSEKMLMDRFHSGCMNCKALPEILGAVGAAKRRRGHQREEEKILSAADVSLCFRRLALGDYTVEAGDGAATTATFGNGNPNDDADEWLLKFRARVTGSWRCLESEECLVSTNIMALATDLTRVFVPRAHGSVLGAEFPLRVGFYLTGIWLSYLDGIEMETSEQHDLVVDGLREAFTSFFVDKSASTYRLLI